MKCIFCNEAVLGPTILVTTAGQYYHKSCSDRAEIEKLKTLKSEYLSLMEKLQDCYQDSNDLQLAYQHLKDSFLRFKVAIGEIDLYA